LSNEIERFAPGSKWRRASSLLLNIVLVIAVFTVASAFQSRGMLDTDRQAAPSLQAETLEGLEFDLGEDDARPTLVYFFAWQSVTEVREYAEKHELNIPVLLGDVSVSRDWKVYGFPTYYVLDSQQRVVRRDIGYTTQLGMLWRTWNVD
jgi:hypothetical protein